MPSGSLYEKTLYLVQNRPVTMTYAKLADLCAGSADGGVTIGWLRQFATGRASCPHVDRVQSVYEILSGSKLFACN